MKSELDQFEAGENVTHRVRRGERGGIVVSVRLSPEDTERLIQLADEAGKTLSQIAREAIRSFIARGGAPIRYTPQVSGTGVGGGELTVYAPEGSTTESSPASASEVKPSGKVLLAS